MENEKVRLFNITDLPFTGKEIRNNEQYVLRDNSFLSNLVISYTHLKPSQATNGHKHDNEEEVYMFTGGQGVMQIDDKHFPVKQDDVVLIKAGEFHKVINANRCDALTFMAIFQKYEGRG